MTQNGRGADYEGENVRHLYGTALAVVMTLVMFFAGAWGYLQLFRSPSIGPARYERCAGRHGGLALACWTAPRCSRWRPCLSPPSWPAYSRWFRGSHRSRLGLPGVLLLAWTALYLVMRGAVEFIPLRSHSFGAGWEGLLFNGILGAVGAVMVFPMFIPSRWRGPRRAESDTFNSDVDDYLAAVTTDDRTRRRDVQSPLVGTVVGGDPAVSGGVRPVDTTRITGASRALRNTGTFRVATGTQPRATGKVLPAAACWTQACSGTYGGGKADEQLAAISCPVSSVSG